jgi:hypothetical protein
MQSVRSSLDEIVSPTGRANRPMRAFATDVVMPSKPRLAIDKKSPAKAQPNQSLLLRLGSIKQQDLLQRYSSLTSNNRTDLSTTVRPSSADRFRQMVLECRNGSR